MPKLTRNDQCQALPTGLIDDGQDAELAAIMRPPFDEVISPYVPGIFRPQADTGSVVEPQASALWLARRNLQSLASPDTLDPFMVYRPPRMAQQGRHPAIAVATILLCQCDDALRQRLFVIRPTRHFTLRRSMLAEHAADPPLGYRQLTPDVVDTSPAARGAQKFPFAASCRISLSSVRSEIARRSRWFSFSRSFIRRA